MSAYSRLEMLFGDTDGAILAEYALIATLIAVACFAAVALVGKPLIGFFKSVGNAM
ncbi:MAG: Flp family type IVb pilin [Candidatus Baltobacteraceae bacterium]